MTEGRTIRRTKVRVDEQFKKRKEGRIEEHADVDRQRDRQTGEFYRQKETERQGCRKKVEVSEIQ